VPVTYSLSDYRIVTRNSQGRTPLLAEFGYCPRQLYDLKKHSVACQQAKRLLFNAPHQGGGAAHLVNTFPIKKHRYNRVGQQSAMNQQVEKFGRQIIDVIGGEI